MSDDVRFDTFANGVGEGVVRASRLRDGISVTVSYGPKRDVQTAAAARERALEFLSAARPKSSDLGGGATVRTTATAGSLETGAA